MNFNIADNVLFSKYFALLILTKRDKSYQVDIFLLDEKVDKRTL